jgi:hypothetical protein
MRPLPALNLAAIALALLASSAARADDAPAEAAAEAAAVTVASAVPTAPAADRAAPERAEPPLVIDPRQHVSPSRPSKAWVTRGEVDGSSYRASFSRGKLDMGVGFDAPVGFATRTARTVDPAGPIIPTVPSLSVGLRSETAGPPPSSLVSRAAGEGTSPAATRRVGLEWKPAQSSVFVRGGLRLTGDERVTMRVKGGRVGVYMKSTF